MLDAVGNTQVDPSKAMASARVVYSIGKPVCFHFRCTTHNFYNCISSPIHPKMGTGLFTYRIKGTGCKVLACDAVLWPESDGEQCSIVGRPSDWYVLPRISLKPLRSECEA